VPLSFFPLQRVSVIFPSLERCPPDGGGPLLPPRVRPETGNFTDRVWEPLFFYGGPASVHPPVITRSFPLLFLSHYHTLLKSPSLLVGNSSRYIVYALFFLEPTILGIFEYSSLPPVILRDFLILTPQLFTQPRLFATALSAVVWVPFSPPIGLVYEPVPAAFGLLEGTLPFPSFTTGGFKRLLILSPFFSFFLRLKAFGSTLL